MESLLDFGPVMQLAQMGMQMDRLDLAKQQEARQVQRDAIQQEQFDRNEALHQRKLAKEQADGAMTTLQKLQSNPNIAFNRRAQMDITKATMAALEHGYGVKLPQFSEDELNGSLEQVNEFMQAYRSGDEKAILEKATTMAAAAPDAFLKVAKDMKEAGDVSFHLLETEQKVEANRAKLAELNVRTGRAKMAENFFTEHSGALGRVALLPMEKEFAEPYRKVISFTGDNVQQAREIFLQQNPILKSEFEKRLLSERPAVEATVQRLEESIDARWAAVREHQAANGAAPQEMVDELAAMEAAYKARRTELSYIDNPYDKDTYKELQKMHQDLKIRQSAAGKQVGEIANERTALMTRRYEDKQALDQNVAKAQQDFAAGGDYSPKAAATFAKQYGVKVEDVMQGIKDPNKPLVNVAMNQEKAESKEVGENYGKQFAELEKSSFASVSKLAKYDRMEQLLNQVTTGALQPTKQRVQELAEGFGLKVDPSLPAAQAMESLTNEMTLELRNPSGGAGMPGAMSDKDREFLSAMSPNLSRTKDGNKLIIETAKQLAKRNMEVAKMARAYRKEHGTFDGGFYDELADWSEKHPLFEGKAIPGEKAAKGSKAPVAAAESTEPATIQSDADYNKLPSGTIFIDPDGKRRRKP